MKKNLRKLRLSTETLNVLTAIPAPILAAGGKIKGEGESGYISCDGITCAVVSCAGSCFEIC